MSLSRRRQYSLVVLLFWLIIFGVAKLEPQWFRQPTQTLEQSQPGLYPVEEDTDGDTIIVNMNGTREIVRFIGVDTPETHKPNTPVQCYGPDAAEFTRKSVEGKKVRLQADPLDTNRDRYGRLLRYVYLQDGTLLDEKLISEGYGFAYTQFPFEKKAEFKTAQQQAEAAKKGLWAKCQVTTESNGRQQTNPL